jgi:hypothetical protein
MKVPRSFSISGVSDMASLRVREGPLVCLWRFKREQRWVCFSKPWAATANQGREPPRPRTALRP